MTVDGFLTHRPGETIPTAPLLRRFSLLLPTDQAFGTPAALIMKIAPLSCKGYVILNFVLCYHILFSLSSMRAKGKREKWSIKMGKRFMQVAVILAGLFAALVVSAAALSEKKNE